MRVVGRMGSKVQGNWLIRMYMSRIQHRFVVLALVCLALSMSGTAAAGVHIGIGFGTSFGHHRHFGHHWYGGLAVYPSWYWYDPWYDYPVIVEPPVVVRERRVIVREHKPPAPQASVQSTEQLSESQQQKRSELLEKLRIGDVSNRVQAVQGLGQFPNDEKVRKALERALLSDRDPQVRKAAAEQFGHLKDKGALPALKQAYAEDSDRDVRQAAYKAIIMMEGYPGSD